MNLKDFTGLYSACEFEEDDQKNFFEPFNTRWLRLIEIKREKYLQDCMQRRIEAFARESYNYFNQVQTQVNHLIEDGVGNLQTVTYAEELGLCCVICFEKLASKKIVLLPCKHKLHKSCVEKLLLTTTKCPLCKKDAAKKAN